MKKVVLLIIALAVMLFLPLVAYAESTDSYFLSEGERIEEALPSETASALENSGISPENSGAAGLSFSGVIAELWELLKSRALKPFKLFCSLLGVTLLCVLAESVSEEGKLKGVFSAVGALCGAGIAALSVGEVLEEALSALGTAANFTAIFIPTLTGIAAVMGHVTSASAVNASVLAATQLFSQIAVNLLSPLCAVILGVSAAGAAEPQLRLDKLGGAVKKLTVWGLTLIMTVFMSIVSVQTAVTSAADSSAIKAAKFVVSQGVPIVGGTISDAVNMVGGGLAMLKGSVGTYGVIAATAIILPVLASLFCYRAALTLAEYTAEVMGQKELAGLYKSCGSVMAIITAVAVCFMLLNIMAVFIMLAITGTAQT